MEARNFIKINHMFRLLIYPLSFITRKRFVYLSSFYRKHDLRRLASLLYRNAFNRKMDWGNPQNLSEKINWLKFNSDTSMWTRLADKYLVRDYVKECGLSDLLVKFYGVWPDANDINFDVLPDSFVLKTNHGCGTVIIVKDKDGIDRDYIKKQMNDWLKIKYGRIYAEPHYDKIEPMIIAEEYLSNSTSSSLIDYKVFCIEGKPYAILVCTNRKIGEGSCLTWYDLDWNIKSDMFANQRSQDGIEVHKPRCLNEMIEAATILSQNHHLVRVDFYVVNNKLYFGEMTFTPRGGYNNNISLKYLEEMGKLIILQ